MIAASAVLGVKAAEGAANTAYEAADLMAELDPAREMNLRHRFDSAIRQIERAMEERDAAPENEQPALNEKIQELFNEGYLAGLESIQRAHLAEARRLKADSIQLGMLGHRFMIGMAPVMLWGGLAVFLISVSCWYQLHQRYQDALIRASVRKAEAELAAVLEQEA